MGAPVMCPWRLNSAKQAPQNCCRGIIQYFKLKRENKFTCMSMAETITITMKNF